MRLDNDTFELPGIPPAPAPEPKPQRTNQAQRMEGIGYLGPKVRERCESCKRCCLHIVNPDQSNEYEALRCDLGDFPVHRGGICPQWEAAR